MPVEVKDPKREGQADEYTPLQLRFFSWCRLVGAKWLIWRTSEDVVRTLGEDPVTEMFNGGKVVATTDDRCIACRRRIVWLMVDLPSGVRHWHPVEFDAYPYQPHECPRRLPKAA